MNYNPKVSVIIPVYGAEKFIAKTLDSVINQTYSNIEILIIDDETRDNSIEICKQFNDARIKIISQKNRGLAGARNTGIRNAQGEYLAFIDADDLWRPDKLERHITHLISNPHIGVSFSRSQFIDENDNPLGIYQMSKLSDITPLDFWCRSPIGNGSAGVFRRRVFDDIKFQSNLYGTIEDFYFDDNFRESEDVECWLRISIQTQWQIEGIAEDLTLYRIHAKGLSADITKMMESWYKLIEKVRSYAPTEMEKWEKPAIAYRLRYLARRAVTLQAGWTSMSLLHRALTTYWQILLEEPRRTCITGAAAYFLCILPKPIYSQIQKLALSITGANQKTRINQEQNAVTS